ncbi:MAG: phosphoglycerate mutase family protein [Muribaculaceae bacterium]|nr:phosphoglycerate mutase family protein [Muribaculaceae bacterium]
MCRYSDQEIMELAATRQCQAEKVLQESGIADIWRKNGCRVNLVGSLRMGLLASHRDIDLHVYSKGITEAGSFAIAAQIARLPGVTELKCINGLHTDEHCVAWHIFYRYEDEIWQFDVIHIEEGTEYDGYFEKIADRISEVVTPEQKASILRLKFGTPEGADYHGVEYYEAVIAGGVNNMRDFEVWVTEHRKKPMYYWIP